MSSTSLSQRCGAQFSVVTFVTWNFDDQISHENWRRHFSSLIWPLGLCLLTFPFPLKQTVCVQTAHAENQAVFACQKEKKNVCFSLLLGRLLIAAHALFNLPLVALISKCLGLQLVPPRKLKIKFLCLSFPFTFDVPFHFYLIGNNQSPSVLSHVHRSLISFREKWRVSPASLRYKGLRTLKPGRTTHLFSRSPLFRRLLARVQSVAVWTRTKKHRVTVIFNFG